MLFKGDDLHNEILLSEMRKRYTARQATFTSFTKACGMPGRGFTESLQFKRVANRRFPRELVTWRTPDVKTESGLTRLVNRFNRAFKLRVG
jgi:hypothetical protein